MSTSWTYDVTRRYFGTDGVRGVVGETLTADLVERPPCPTCGRRMLRPDVVWFGEMPYELDAIDEALLACDVFAAIGTSGAVYPAAGFVMTAAEWGARTVELNLDQSGASADFDVSRRGPATELVPAWVDDLVGARDLTEQ